MPGGVSECVASRDGRFMIFYQAPGSPLLHPTQAAAGKGFVQHDVPVDKAGLMAYVNALLTRLAEPELEITRAVEPEGEFRSQFRVDAPGQGNSGQGAPVCSACFRTKEMSELMGKSLMVSNFEHLLATVNDPHTLAKIRALLL